jgi:2-amino-4-hydroxy-6-hydroxymethyldihydropteridine diphosphokinase
MPRVWISVGSNIERERHVPAALDQLREHFGTLVVSPVYEAEAVGFDGDPFFNLVVGIETDRPPGELHRLMRVIEDRQGRQRSAAAYSSRTLDLDVLTYGDRVTDEGGKHLPRHEIVEYAFVLAPLADVAPSERHPELGETYARLWDDYRGADRDALRRLADVRWIQPDEVS